MNIATVTTLPLAAGFVVGMAAFFGWACVSIAEQRHADTAALRKRRR